MPNSSSANGDGIVQDSSSNHNDAVQDSYPDSQANAQNPLVKNYVIVQASSNASSSVQMNHSMQMSSMTTSSMTMTNSIYPVTTPMTTQMTTSQVSSLNHQVTNSMMQSPGGINQMTTNLNLIKPNKIADDALGKSIC